MYKVSVLLLLVLPFRGLSQVHWTKAEGLSEQLPYSMSVYLTRDSVHGRPFRACYIVADPEDLKVDYTARVGEGKRYTPSEFFQNETGAPPYIVVNGSFFDSTTNRNLQMVMRDGKLIAYNQSAIRTGPDSLTRYHYVTPSAIGITSIRKLDVGWVFTDSTKDYPLLMLKGPANPKYSKGERSNPSILHIHSENANAEIGAKCMQWDMVTAVGGGPTLVKRGQVFISSHEELQLVGRENDLEARTAMGCTRDNKLIILVIEAGYPGQSSGASLLEEALIMRDLGCWEALNMSGGSSTCLLINGQPIMRPAGASGQEEPVSSVFMIKSLR